MNTNVLALTAQRHLSAVSTRLADRSARLSSGLRIAQAADDAAGLGVSESLRAQVRSHAVASRNLQDGVSLARTADGALGQASELLGRVRELVLQAHSGTLSDEDRAVLDQEYQAVVDELGRLFEHTEFNGGGLFDEFRRVRIQAGIHAGDGNYIHVGLENLIPMANNLDKLNLVDPAKRALVHERIEGFQARIRRMRGALGATENQLSSALASSLAARENLAAAESRLRDVDVAREAALLARDRVVQQAAVSVLAQARLAPESALLLLR